MGSGPRLPAKKDVVLALLESTDVLVHLDPRRDKVRVPPWLKNQPSLILQIGLNMPVPITDLEVNDDAVSCTLSFNRSPFFCLIPWPAVYALIGSDGRAMIWPDDIPPEVAAQAAKVAQAAEQKKERKKHLRALKADGEDEEAPPEEPRRIGTAAKRADDGDIARRGRLPAAGAELEAVAPAEPDVSSPRNSAPSEPPEPDGKGKRSLPPYLRVVK